MGYRYQVVITALALGAIVSCDSTPISKIENTEPQIGITVVANKESYGCNSGASSLTKSGNYKLTYEGIERSYRLHLPRSYQSTSAYPLVMLFHGWGGDQNDFLQDKALIREADERGYILVAPTGLGSGEPDFAPNAWSFSGSTSGLDGDGGTGISGAICDYTATKNYNYTSCSDTAQNTCAWTHCQQDDIGFTLALVAHVGNEVCVNTSNVFASGASNGGMFAWELAQNTRSASTFRAIAPVIGLPHRGYTRAQGKNETLPAILISGNLDATVPPGDWGDENFTTTSDGDTFYYASAAVITKAWAKARGCNVERPAVFFDVGYPLVQCRSHCLRSDAWPDVLDCRAEMGHTYEPWTMPLVLDFFDHHLSNNSD